MGSAFAFYKNGQYPFGISFFLVLVVCSSRSSEDHSPTGFQNLAAGSFKLNAVYLAPHGCCGKFAVGIKNSNEPPGYKVEHPPFHICQINGRLPGGNNSMVIGHFRIVEYFLRFRQMLSLQRCGQRFVSAQSLQDTWTFGVNIIAQESSIYARICSHLFLVERLDKLQCFVGRIGKLPVALHLQGSQVEQTRRRFPPLLLGHGSHRERQILDAGQQLFAARLVRNRFNATVVFLPLGLLSGRKSLLFFRIQNQFFFTFLHQRGERGFPVKSVQHPILLRHKMFYFQLTVYNQRQGRRLHPPDRQHLPVLPILHGIKPCGVHAQQPVTDGAAQPGFIKRLEIGSIAQLGKPFVDSLLGERRNPQAFHGTVRPCFLHHPALDELPLLPGIATIDNHVGLLHEAFDDSELAFIGGIFYQFNAKTWRNHRQILQPPLLPVGRIFVRLFQCAEVSEGPRHLVTVSLDVSVFLLPCPQHVGYVARHGRFFGNANYHSVFKSYYSGDKDTKKYQLIRDLSGLGRSRDVSIARHWKAYTEAGSSI